MDTSVVLLISVVGALLNMLLSATVPCLIKKSNLPLLDNVKLVFESNRQVIITSSVLVGILIFVSLSVAPEIESAVLRTNTLSPSQFKYLSQLNF